MFLSVGVWFVRPYILLQTFLSPFFPSPREYDVYVRFFVTKNPLTPVNTDIPFKIYVVYLYRQRETNPPFIE